MQSAVAVSAHQKGRPKKIVRAPSKLATKIADMRRDCGEANLSARLLGKDIAVERFSAARNIERRICSSQNRSAKSGAASSAIEAQPWRLLSLRVKTQADAAGALAWTRSRRFFEFAVFYPAGTFYKGSR